MAAISPKRMSRAARHLPDGVTAADVVPLWELPRFGDKIARVPVFLVARLTEMAGELPGTHLDHRIYYERVHALLVIASTARQTNPAAFDLGEPPTGGERDFGFTLGQAFHQGISLADVCFAAKLPAERVVAIGKRTIRRKEWLKRL